MGSLLGFPGVDPVDAAIGERLRRWREQRSVEPHDLAEALGLSIEGLRRAEAGRAHLDSIQIGRATQRLHLPVWALVSDTPAY